MTTTPSANRPWSPPNGPDARYERALREATDRLRGEFSGGLVGHPILRLADLRHPIADSDLDLHVLVDATRRQRRNLVVDGVEVELSSTRPPASGMPSRSHARGRDRTRALVPVGRRLFF